MKAPKSVPCARPIYDSGLGLGIAVVFSLFLLVLILPSLVQGAPSWGDEFTLGQPDGTEVQVKIWGDEFYRVVESLDGFTLVRDSSTGEICYAELSDDGRELLSTGFVVGGVSGEDLGLERHLRIDPEAARAIAQAVRDEAAAIERAELATKDASATPVPSTVGDVKGLLLIIDFSDALRNVKSNNRIGGIFHRFLFFQKADHGMRCLFLKLC